ncbi:MAG: hypothetical protein R3D62_01355 [Xanthobacteraceae bacterium]
MRSILALTTVVFGMLGAATMAAAQTPVAVVEDVKGKPAGIEFMDYVTAGQIIKLGATDTIVLGYMSSCWRETITGGTVVVGAEHSSTHLSQVDRVKVNCDPEAAAVSQQEARAGAVTVFRSVKPLPDSEPAKFMIHGLSPIVEVGGAGRLVLERLDKSAERYTAKVPQRSLIRGRFYDLAKANKALAPGGTYVAKFGDRSVVFKVDPGAKAGEAPIISRLVRFE